jgi:hypothetical protein
MSFRGRYEVRLLLAIVDDVALALFAPGTAHAQAIAGSQLSGVVRDSTSATIPGAEVTVTKTDTGMIRTVFTGADGAYTFPNLPIGPYQLKVVLQGFNTYVRDGIVLQVSSNPEVNVTLAVGAISEQVTVTANASLVETRSTGVGQVIDNQRVMEMPLNGRQATELIFLSGLATAAPAGDLNTNKNFPTVTISVAGGQANGITYIMDGGTHNDPFNNLNLPTPFPDALQEFKVETSALPARYGYHAASAVNLVTKSGSNQVHGDAFEFLRNYHFNARNFFAPGRDSLNRNQFGGTLGAPIVRNKLFFFGGYQGRIEKSNPPESISYVPTQAMLNGDFTTIASPACNGGRQLTLGGGFAGNRIDPSRLNPVALNFLQHVPVSSDPCGKLQYGIPNNNTEHQGLGKVDYTINRNSSLFARYFYAVYDNPATYDGKNVLTLSRTGQNNQVHSLVLGHNQILSASTLNSLHVTINRTLNDRPLPQYFSATDLGSRISSLVPGYVGVNVTGNGFAVGNGATNPGYFNSKGFQIADDLDLVRGAHQFSIGGNWIHSSIETLNNRPTNGAFTFNGQGTGLSLADFMLGVVSGGFLQGNPVYDFDHSDYAGAYVQDNWRVRPNLTVNLGLRWEPFLPVENSFSWVSFSIRGASPERAGTAYRGAGRPVFPGDAGYPDDATTFSKIPSSRVADGLDAERHGRPASRLVGRVHTRRTCSSTPGSRQPAVGAQITLPNQPGASRPTSDIPAATRFRG